MEQRDFGTTGLRVPALGFGAGSIGGTDLSEEEVATLLGTALDLGMTLVDTAPSYGAAEERIGRHLAQRRDEFLLCTKLGYGVPGTPDWTGDCIRLGVEQALQRLRTDRLDVAFLHSCPADVLARGEVVEALAGAVQAGKVRVAGYSGDGAALELAAGDARFGALMASLNPVDQALLAGTLGRAKQRGAGVLAKRPLANAVWVDTQPPERPDRREYWQRWQALQVEPDADPAATCLRFAAYTWGVDCAVLGTRRVERLRAAAAAVAEGPLPDARREALLAGFRARRWPGLI